MRKTEDRRKEPGGRNPLENLLSPAHVATAKEVSPTAVIRAIREGRLPAWERGGQYFVPLREVEKWQPVHGRGKKKEQ